MALVEHQLINSGIHILTLKNKTIDNWFNLDFIDSMNKALDTVENWIKDNSSTPAALVTISSNSKIYSNGLFLEQAFEKGSEYFLKFHHLLKRFLVFPIPTVAGNLVFPKFVAINGHAFAGGCMFSLCHDYRIMRGDKGFICMNEVDLPSALTPGMLSLVRCKVPMNALRDMIIQGHRFTAQEALENHFVDEIAPDSESVLPLAIHWAKKWSGKAKAGIIYGYLKEEMYVEAVRDLKNSKLGLVSIATGIPEAKL
jgi:enoyl-CoA hydratase/carnithine racemase